MARKDETLLKKKFMEAAKGFEKCWFVKIQQATIVGTPDILMCIRGYFIGVELKSANGKISPLQKYNLDKIILAGGKALVVGPENLQVAIDNLGAFSRGEPPVHTDK